MSTAPLPLQVYVLSGQHYAFGTGLDPPALQAVVVHPGHRHTIILIMCKSTKRLKGGAGMSTTRSTAL